MEGCSVRGAAESGARSNEEVEEQGGDEIRDLSHLLMDAARLIQTAEESQKQAEASCQFGNRLLNQKAGYRALLRSHAGLSTSYGTLLTALHDAEDVLSPVKAQDGGRERSESPSARTGPPENGEDLARSHSVKEKTSHHKQVETVRNEEHMGEAFPTERRLSHRGSPSSSADRLSPLLSDEEVNIMMPITQSPSSRGSGRFTNKIIHRERTQEGTDSDEEATESP